MDQSTLQRLNALDERIEALYKPLRISDHTAPLNRQMERIALFASHARGKVYNPQFVYRETPDGWDAPLREFLPEIQPENNTWEGLIYADVMQTLASLRDAETHDPQTITENTVNVYGAPTHELVALAREELAAHFEDAERRDVSSEQVAESMREALTRVNLTDWQVIVDPVMSARMSVRGVDKQVKVREGEFFTASEAKRLLVHEVGTHVFRAVNGQLQPLRLLRFGLTNYILTEEGMATYHEYRYGVRNPDDTRRYALRVLAAHLSLNNDFYTVFCEVAQHTTIEEAFDIVTRAKRGFEDTSAHGAHVKDKVYFEGFRLVSAYLTAHPDDYSLLMCGKVSVDMLPMLRTLKADDLLHEPQYLPEMLM